MNLLKRAVPYLIVVVIVTVLYNLQHEETLSVGEARYIEQFSPDYQEETASEKGESPSGDAEEEFQENTNEILSQQEPGDEIHLAIFTSNSEEEAVQWENYFPEEAQDQYEFDVHTFNIDDFQSNNSAEFVDYEEWTVINDLAPDLVIYEPLAYRDNTSLDESMDMTAQIINRFDGNPVLKIPSYENAANQELYVQEWTEFAEEAEVQYVGPDEQALSDSALTQGDELENDS
ncbi:hypothetical protein [Salicibibacter kimchii]|uniref:SGNH/GDSL hydrolase family protein n=1 Tax=Salicibibacter kimchii TaxID=2099786 RepID=A0A345BXS5_9BACI|nr:hypothetical protein [Salicibibacter kimchii]AXF55756.1 hypothetical protein DT065_06775 [Salicibibacter kimchii]